MLVTIRRHLPVREWFGDSDLPRFLLKKKPLDLFIRAALNVASLLLSAYDASYDRGLARCSMAYDVRVIPIREFLKTDITGEVDMSASRKMLGDLMAVCRRENMSRVLIDCREASSHATTLDVWMLARDLGSLGVTYENRVAVLNRPKDNFDRGAFLEVCATNRGYQIRAFREFEMAFSWLTSEDSFANDHVDSEPQ